MDFNCVIVLFVLVSHTFDVAKGQDNDTSSSYFSRSRTLPKKIGIQVDATSEFSQPSTPNNNVVEFSDSGLSTRNMSVNPTNFSGNKGQGQDENVLVKEKFGISGANSNANEGSRFDVSSPNINRSDCLDTLALENQTEVKDFRQSDGDRSTSELLYNLAGAQFFFRNDTDMETSNDTNLPASFSTDTADQLITTEPHSDIVATPYDVELGGETIPYCGPSYFCVERCGYKLEVSTAGDMDTSTWEDASSTFGIPNLSAHVNDQLYTTDVFHGNPGIARQGVTVSSPRETFPPPISARLGLTNRESEGSIRSGPGLREDNKCPNLTLSGEVCFCDEKCVLYSDCCADIFHHCLNLSDTNEILDYIWHIKSNVNQEILQNGISQAWKENPRDVENITDIFVAKFGSCEHVSESFEVGVLLISRCPENTTNVSVKDKCEKPSSSLLPPVTKVYEDLEVSFKNVYCAQCHGLCEEELKLWSPQLICSPNVIETNRSHLLASDVSKLLKSHQCIMTFKLPHKTCGPRICNTKTVLWDGVESQLDRLVSMGVCSPVDAFLCQSYSAPRNGYKNVHCERCLDTLHQGSNRRCDAEYTPKPGGGLLKDPPEGPRAGILLILDITGKYSASDGNEFNTCTAKDVFNPFTQECQELICAQGYEPHYGKCYLSEEDALFVDKSTQMFPKAWNEFNIMINMSDNRFSCQNIASEIMDLNLKSSDLKLVVRNIEISCNQAGSVDRNIFINMLNVTGAFSQCCRDGRLAAVKITIDKMLVALSSGLNTAVLNNVALLAESVIDVPGNTEKAEVLITNLISSSQSVCPFNGTMTQSTDFTVVEYKEELHAVFNSSQHQIFYPLQNIGYEKRLSWTANFSVTITETVYVCESKGGILSNSNCSVVAYWLNETSFDGSRLLILQSGQHFEPEKFEIRDHQVFVCLDVNMDVGRMTLKQSKVYLVLSWLFTSLSIVFLLAMVICYCVFPELCTLPGKMTANLAGTMLLTFLSNLFTLVELHHKYICPFVAAVSHLVTLAHFGWMSAIAVNMAFTFGPGSFNRRISLYNNKAFIRYSIAVWGCSAAIVLISVILDIVHDNPQPSLEQALVFMSSNDSLSSENGDDRLVSSSLSSSPTTTEAEFPRYGYPYCTWFSGPLWSRLAFVVIPYVITFLINTVCFILTLVGLHSYSKAGANLGKSSENRIQCVIYIKLSTAMGFAWILSLLTSFVDEEDVLPYIYVTLVLLQGVLLFLAFMANKRVYSLIIKRATGEEKTKSTAMSTS